MGFSVTCPSVMFSIFGKDIVVEVGTKRYGVLAVNDVTRLLSFITGDEPLTPAKV